MGRHFFRVNFADNQAMCDAPVRTVAASSSIAVGEMDAALKYYLFFKF